MRGGRKNIDMENDTSCRIETIVTVLIAIAIALLIVIFVLGMSKVDDKYYKVPDSKSQYKWTGSLIKALKGKNTKDVKQLLERKHFSVNCYYYNPKTSKIIYPFILACKNGNYEIIKMFIERGAMVSGNYSDTGGYDPLQKLLWCNNSDKETYKALKLFVDNGADMDGYVKHNRLLLMVSSLEPYRVKDDDGEYILYRIAESSGLKELNKRKAKFDEKTARYIVKMFDLVVKNLDEPIKEITAKDTNREKTFLMTAVEAGNLKLVKYIIENKLVDVNVRDEEGNTALFYPIDKFTNNFTEDVKIKEYLVENGAGKTFVNINGYRAYDDAVLRGDRELAEVLKP